MARKLDSQQIELISRSVLEARLIREGFEVARPARDKGIDLIAFFDSPGTRFHAVPIQIKAATGESFSLHKRLKKRGIVMAYIWHVQSDQPEIYLIPHDAALQLSPRIDRRSKSWRDHGRWEEQAGKERRKSLRPYLNRFDILRPKHRRRQKNHFSLRG